jgi:hypothetical protein
MTTTMTSSDDELILTDVTKEYGISKITRHGTTREGFVIHVIVNDTPLVFAVGNSWNSALTNLKKACERFNINYNANDNKINVRELQRILESTLVQNASWVMGYDIEAIKSGFTVKYNGYYNNNEELQEIAPKTLSIPEAIRTHSGTIIVNGIIIAISDTYQLVKKSRWKCYKCEEIIEREVVNILDVPTKPRECMKCRSKHGFSHNHEYINVTSLKVQQEDNRADSLDSLRINFIFSIGGLNAKCFLRLFSVNHYVGGRANIEVNEHLLLTPECLFIYGRSSEDGEIWPFCRECYQYFQLFHHGQFQLIPNDDYFNRARY